MMKTTSLLRDVAYILPIPSQKRTINLLTKQVLAAFIQALEEVLKGSPLAGQLREHYERHFNKSAEHFKKQLWADMAIIYHKWHEKNEEGQDVLNTDEKAAMARKLAEGAKGCTEGFLDRVNSVAISCEREFTLLDCLRFLRMNIINNIASLYTNNGVHEHNTIFKVAEKEGYGVRANHNDGYSGGIAPAELKSVLAESFERHYHPLAILKQIILEIRAELVHYGYAGKQNEKSYEYGEYKKWFEVIQTFFRQKEEISLQHFLSLDEDFSVHDIHWPRLIYYIWQHLTEHFFNIDSERLKILNAVLDPDAQEKESLDFKLLLKREMDKPPLIHTDEDLFYMLNTTLSEDYRTGLFYAYLDITNPERTLFLHQALRLSEHVSVIDLLLKNIRQLPEEIQILSQKNNGSALMMVVEHRPETVVPLLGFIATLPEDAQIEILSEKRKNGWNALMLAARNQTKVIVSLLQHIATFPEEAQMDILSRKSSDDWNAVMLAARNNAAAAEFFLKFIAKLPQKTQIDILSQQNKDGWNAVMIAVRYHPTVLPLLLELIAKLPEKAQINIFTQKNNVYCNAVMLAARNEPAAMLLLLKHVVKFHEDVHIEILSQKDNAGWNALMLAAQHQPEAGESLLNLIAALPEKAQIDLLSHHDSNGWNALLMMVSRPTIEVFPLLKLIVSLPIDAQIKILSQETKEGWHVLMLAVRSHPKAVEPLLKLITSLPEDAQIQILGQKNNEGSNALMLAAQHQPEAVEPLLNLIATLPADAQINILTEKSTAGWNAVMIAAQYQPQTEVPLLNLIDTLPEKDQIGILTQQMNTGSNALMLAAQHQPEAVVPLLQRIAKLPEDAQIKILSCQTNDGWNAVMLAARDHPAAAEPLLKVITQLPENIQFDILSHQTKEGWNALMLAAHNHPTVAEQMLKTLGCLNSKIRIKEILEHRNNLGNNLDSLISGKQSLTLVLNALNNVLEAQDNTKIQQALRFEGRWLKWASKPMKNDIDVVLIALTQNPNSLVYAAKRLNSDEILCAIAQISDDSKRRKVCENYKARDEYKKLKTICMLDSYIEQCREESNGLYYYLSSFCRSRNANSNEVKISAAEKFIYCLKGGDPEYTAQEQLALQNGRLKQIRGAYEGMKRIKQNAFERRRQNIYFWRDINLEPQVVSKDAQSAQTNDRRNYHRKGKRA